MGLLETKNIENEAKIDRLQAKNVENEAKMAKQEEEIVKLKAKIDVEVVADHFYDTSFDDDQLLHSSIDHNKQASFTERKESSSSARAILPSSCRDLGLIGHSLDGLYLVQNQDTKKIEAVYCDFGTSAKLNEVDLFI